MKFYFPLLVTIFIFSCTNEEQIDTPTEEEVSDKLSALTQELIEETPTLAPNDRNQFFDIVIPSRMFEMEDLNKVAQLQYGYVAEVELENGETIVLENYLMVMMELKSDIESYPVEIDLDAMVYRDDVVNSLISGMDEVEILTKNPKIEKVNGMDCVKNEIKGTFSIINKDPVDLYYYMGVFEGEKAFYQVLSWCIDSQRDEFEQDMKIAIDSFKEN